MTGKSNFTPLAIVKKTYKMLKFPNVGSLIIIACNLYFIGYFRAITVSFPLPVYIHGGGVPQDLMMFYIFIILLTIIFITVKIFKETLISNVLGVALLISTFYSCWVIYLLKSHFLNAEPEIRALYIDAMFIDLISFLLIVGLIAYQISRVFHIFKRDVIKIQA